MQNVKVGDKVRIISDTVNHQFNVGEKVQVTYVEKASVMASNGIRERWITHNFELIHDEKLELIANLSAEVVRLSKRVEALERNYSPSITINDTYGKPPQVIAQELAKTILERFKANTVMLTREDIIEKAKRDVDDLLRKIDSKAVGFNVNREKRVVVAYAIKLSAIFARSTAFARCAPDDCFNVHIGKAIALRRALGLEVPQEYVKAPMPAEAKVGDIVYSDRSGLTYTVTQSHTRVLEEIEIAAVNNKDWFVIIDDSRE